MSKKDVVYKSDPDSPHAISLHRLDEVIVPTIEIPEEDRGQLILLEPHSNSSFLDHEVNSPTYRSSIENRLEEYNQHKGQYLPEEKGQLK